MKLLVVLVVLIAAVAAAQDQKTDEATYISTYATHPYPLTYTSGYPYTAYNAPAVYSNGYTPLAYSSLYNGAFHGYGAPLVHSLKKRDTAAAEEDQKADEATYVSTYAAHPYPLTYTAGYPYTPYSAPAVYGNGYTPLAYSSLYNGAFHGYGAPLVHSLKKRDTAAAEEDQQADEATYVSTYAAHQYPLTYAGYPYQAPVTYGFHGLRTPASTVPVTYSALPYAYGHTW